MGYLQFSVFPFVFYAENKNVLVKNHELHINLSTMDTMVAVQSLLTKSINVCFGALSCHVISLQDQTGRPSKHGEIVAKSTISVLQKIQAVHRQDNVNDFYSVLGHGGSVIRESNQQNFSEFKKVEKL